MSISSFLRAWNIGTTNVKGWLFDVPASPAKAVVVSVKGWSTKGW